MTNSFDEYYEEMEFNTIIDAIQNEEGLVLICHQCLHEVYLELNDFVGICDFCGYENNNPIDLWSEILNLDN